MRSSPRTARSSKTSARLRESGWEPAALSRTCCRAELLIAELDRERANNQQAVAAARAALARQIHVRPDAEIRTLPQLPRVSVPKEIERLNSLAQSARPELLGRLAAIARDEKAVELARKRFYPNITLGVTYMDMEKTNATAPKTASGSPNVGLFVGFNLPVHQNKYQAAVCEAQERARADAKLYEAQRDETLSEIQDLMVQAKVQENVLTLLRDSIGPRTRQTLELARSDYAKGNVDYATVLSAVREVLQVQLQVAQVEGELGKALAGLERAVGHQISEQPQDPARGPSSLDHPDCGDHHVPASPPTATPARFALSGPLVMFRNNAITWMTFPSITTTFPADSAVDRTGNRSSVASRSVYPNPSIGSCRRRGPSRLLKRAARSSRCDCPRSARGPTSTFRQRSATSGTSCGKTPAPQSS